MPILSWNTSWVYQALREKPKGKKVKKTNAKLVSFSLELTRISLGLNHPWNPKYPLHKTQGRYPFSVIQFLRHPLPFSALQCVHRKVQVSKPLDISYLRKAYQGFEFLGSLSS